MLCEIEESITVEGMVDTIDKYRETRESKNLTFWPIKAVVILKRLTWGGG